MEPLREPSFQVAKKVLMPKFRALCGFMYDWVGNKRKLMGTRGIWLELFENLMKTKGFWWVIDGNKRNLIGTIWELGENKRILMGYWQEQEEFDWNYLRIWWKQKDFDGLLMGTRGIWLEPFENLMRTKGFWWVIDGNKRNLMGTVWENLMRTMDRNWTCPSLKKTKKHPMGACWCHSISSPRMLYPNVLFRDKLLG